MRRDPLDRLLALNGVSAAVSGARAAVDEAYRHPALGSGGGPQGGAGGELLRGRAGQVAAESSLRAAVASAALAGSRYEVAAVREGVVVTDPVLQGALRCAEALPGLVDRWRQAPRQVLARLHLLAARGVVDDASLGRPVRSPEVADRLDMLVDGVLRDAAPGLLRAAVVHGELLALRAFPGPSGVVARAAARLELAASGFDPGGLIPVEVGHLAREPEYVGGAGTFVTGTPDGLRAWLRHCATAVELGAAELVAIGSAVADQPP
jgi:hypothetical protein